MMIFIDTVCLILIAIEPASKLYKQWVNWAHRRKLHKGAGHGK